MPIAEILPTLLQILKNPPPWFGDALGVILCVFLFLALWDIRKKTLRAYENLSTREERLSKVYEDLINEREKYTYATNLSKQYKTTLENIIDFMKDLNDLRNYVDSAEVISKAEHIIQRAVESLASDVKQLAGERHRCGFWVYIAETNTLNLITASSGFPPNYIGKKLNKDKSIAGRAFRTGEIENVSNVHEDPEWEPNPQSNSPYTALICIPIADIGVLTIDALNPMSRDHELIGEVYCKVIEGAVIELTQALPHIVNKETVDS